MAVRTIRKTVQLHPAQAEFRRSPALYRAFVGGRGAGKSWCGAYDLLRRVRPGGAYLVGSPTGVMMQDTTFPTLKALATDLGCWAGVKLTPYPTATILLERGEAALRFRTADDPERMRGPNLRGAWLDEASLMHEDAFKIAIGSLRDGQHVGWLSATFTPKGPNHWTHREFTKADACMYRARTDQNPFLSPAFAATLKRQYGETQFARQELGGEFVSIEGAEFPAEWFPDDGPESIWFDQWPQTWVAKSLYLDPSKGMRDDQGDYQAHVWGMLAAVEGRNRIYLDAHLDREPIPDMIRRGADLCRAWQPGVWDIEDNGTMGFLEPVITHTLGQQIAPWSPVTNHEPKVQRIRRLAAYLSLGMIRIRNTPGGRLLRAQLGDFPLGQYDDSCDAAAGAVRRLELLSGAA